MPWPQRSESRGVALCQRELKFTPHSSHVCLVDALEDDNTTTTMTMTSTTTTTLPPPPVRLVALSGKQSCSVGSTCRLQYDTAAMQHGRSGLCVLKDRDARSSAKNSLHNSHVSVGASRGQGFYHFILRLQVRTVHLSWPLFAR